MSAPTITDPVQLEATHAQTKQFLEEATEAERAAFVAWQEAYGAYQVACDDATIARATWAEAIGL